MGLFCDTKELLDENIRPCKKCGKYPTPEGYDACLGYLPGVRHACCGHGFIDDEITYGYLYFENGKIIRFIKEEIHER